MEMNERLCPSNRPARARHSTILAKTATSKTGRGDKLLKAVHFLSLTFLLDRRSDKKLNDKK